MKNFTQTKKSTPAAKHLGKAGAAISVPLLLMGGTVAAWTSGDAGKIKKPAPASSVPSLVQAAKEEAASQKQYAIQKYGVTSVAAKTSPVTEDTASLLQTGTATAWDPSNFTSDRTGSKPKTAPAKTVKVPSVKTVKPFSTVKPSYQVAQVIPVIPAKPPAAAAPAQSPVAQKPAAPSQTTPLAARKPVIFPQKAISKTAPEPPQVQGSNTPRESIGRVPTRVSASRASAVRSTASRAASARSAKAIAQSVKSPVAPVLRPIPPFQKTMPRGSYLVKPARLDNAAYTQAISRGMILKRYQYAWKTSPEETLRRLRGLRLTRLQEAGVYRVYYARANGAWGYKVRRVPVGTLVFTLPETTRPLMLQVCGNPVEEVLPARNARQKGMVPPFTPHESEAGLVLEDLGDTGLYAFSPQTPDFLGGGEVFNNFSGNLVNVAPIVGESASSFPGAVFPVSLGGGGFNIGSVLFPIAGTAIGSQISNFGGHGTTPIRPSEVPEPSGGAVIVSILGTLGLALAWPTMAARQRKPQPIRTK